MDESYAIGIDIGGTKISFALIDRSGHLIASHRLPTLAADGAEAVFAQIAKGFQYVQASTDKQITGIGIGCPGRLDPRTGLVYKATNLDWHNVNLRDGLQRHLKTELPIFIQQDANALAVGEYIFGAAQNSPNFVLITIGTGLGGAALMNGQVVVGTSFTGMEIGHMPLDVNGRLCVCGQRGCPEMYISGIGLQTTARELLAQYPQSQLNALEFIETTDILRAYSTDDDLATALIDDMTDWLAKILITCMSILNPSLFVIGGGLGHALFETIHRDVTKKLQVLNRDIHVEVPMLESQLNDSAIGAASLVWFSME